MNKERQKEHARKHYLNNREVMIEKAKISNVIANARNSEYIKNYLMKNSCVDCGENNPIVLEFDHIRGIKKYNVSNMKFRGYSLQTIKNEISKCEIRCANCHRIATHNRKNQ